jgi:hypothetical protein
MPNTDSAIDMGRYCTGTILMNQASTQAKISRRQKNSAHKKSIEP